MTGLPKTRNTCPWPAKRSDAVEWPIARDKLGFFVTKSTRPSMRRAPNLAFAKLSKTVIPWSLGIEGADKNSKNLSTARPDQVLYTTKERAVAFHVLLNIDYREDQSFVGNALRHTCHWKFFTLFGTWRAQIPFHNFVLGLVCKGDWSNSASSLRNL